MAAPTVPTVDTLNVQTGREESKKMPWTPKAPIVPIIIKKIDRPGKESEGQRNVKSVLRDLAIWSQIDPQCFMQYDNISENLMLMGPEVRLTDMTSTITQNFGDYFTITRSNPNEMVITYNPNATPVMDESVWMTRNQRASHDEDAMRQNIENYAL